MRLPLPGADVQAVDGGARAVNDQGSSRSAEQSFCSLLGKEPEVVFRSDNDDVEILSIPVTKEDVKTTAAHLKQRQVAKSW